MQSNTYLYIIIAAVLIGIGTLFMGKDQLATYQEKLLSNVQLEKNVQKIEKTIEEESKQVQVLNLQRRKLQNEVDNLARVINNTLDNMKGVESLRETYAQSIENNEKKLEVIQTGIAQIQDEMQESIAVIDRSLNELTQNNEKDIDVLRNKEEKLDEDNLKETKLQSQVLSQLKTDKEKIVQELQRTNDLSPVKITSPWTVAKILDYSLKTHEIIIDTGKDSNISKGMRFMVYSEPLGASRIYKGMMFIKDVFDFTAIGKMVYNKSEGNDPIKGDVIGGVTYKESGLTFFLSGDFRGRYNKDRLSYLLKKIGNRVADELSTDVDIFVVGALAEAEIPEATAFGVPIIDEALLSSYLGE